MCRKDERKIRHDNVFKSENIINEEITELKVENKTQKINNQSLLTSSYEQPKNDLNKTRPLHKSFDEVDGPSAIIIYENVSTLASIGEDLKEIADSFENNYQVSEFRDFYYKNSKYKCHD